ncbi:MAG: hypothetical protein WAM70_13465 [Pyrinomonadaceae bacterium]
MKLKHALFLICFAASAMAAIGVTAGLRSANTSTQNPAGNCDKICLQTKVNKHLMLMGEFGNDEALDASLKDLRAAGPELVGIVQDTYRSWTQSAGNLTGNARPAEMRWRAVHLLGSLNSKEAAPFLYELAKKPLPNPKSGEIPFIDEYKLRLRAIGGLEKLKATAELKDLHERGGVLRNPTAASLYEIGVNVGGVSKVAVKKALAGEDDNDHKDIRPNKHRPPQMKKPGLEKTHPIRRPGTPVPSTNQ